MQLLCLAFPISGNKDTFAPGGIRRVSLHGRFISCFGGGQQRRVRVFLHRLFFQGTLIQNTQYTKLASVGSTGPESLEQPYPQCCSSCSLALVWRNPRPSSAHLQAQNCIQSDGKGKRERKVGAGYQLWKVSTRARK